ncbi:hypothetical protein BC938DRAFT_481954 [Jimgerdemannia flammicorona]|uniref:Uncharacterized protein n=1 Tax=Jimgerdemannia flammicorona TaxID=994334 RepID=A0A433R0L4_9FUNG|nr:hypothetical protein BC938DRAFT_481954 [Jimgerdemannia flammicorona]
MAHTKTLMPSEFPRYDYKYYFSIGSAWLNPLNANRWTWFELGRSSDGVYGHRMHTPPNFVFGEPAFAITVFFYSIAVAADLSPLQERDQSLRRGFTLGIGLR